MPSSVTLWAVPATGKASVTPRFQHVISLTAVVEFHRKKYPAVTSAQADRSEASCCVKAAAAPDPITGVAPNLLRPVDITGSADVNDPINSPIFGTEARISGVVNRQPHMSQRSESWCSLGAVIVISRAEFFVGFMDRLCAVLPTTWISTPMHYRNNNCLVFHAKINTERKSINDAPSCVSIRIRVHQRCFCDACEHAQHAIKEFMPQTFSSAPRTRLPHLLGLALLPVGVGPQKSQIATNFGNSFGR